MRYKKNDQIENTQLKWQNTHNYESCENVVIMRYSWNYDSYKKGHNYMKYI